jgi:hypothetical protein
MNDWRNGIFGIFSANFCKLLFTDFSPLSTYRKSRMSSAVPSSSTHHAILRHGVRAFFWPMGRMVTRNSIRPWEQRSSVVRIYKHPAF